MIRVLYVGDGSIRLEHEVKGAEVIHSVSRIKDTARSLRDALRTDQDIQVTHLPPIQAFDSFPETAEELRSNYDMVLLSDVGSETLTTYPLEDDRPQRPRPNRMRELAKFIQDGGGLIYCGGYYGFQGRYGHAHWYGTPVAELLGVSVMNVVDDREDTPEGVFPSVEQVEHPVTRGIPWDSTPAFFGYNKTERRTEGNVLATIEGYPFIVTRDLQNSRVLTFTSDPCAHWGTYFTKWEYYPTFWTQAVRWVTGN